MNRNVDEFRLMVVKVHCVVRMEINQSTCGSAYPHQKKNQSEGWNTSPPPHSNWLGDQERRSCHFPIQHASIAHSSDNMFSSQAISTPDFLDTQQAYIAHFYNLLKSFLSFPPHNPNAPSITQNDLSFLPKVSPEGLSKRTFECCLCGAVYPTPLHLAQHSCPQMTQTAFQCRDCHKVGPHSFYAYSSRDMQLP